ncbi:Choline-glycine betaine transporter [Algoriphagus locisalis]|uniref:Choline-glycine betaine transporter n=1 Tax=Algoriphagus locisalis TaxID=305507 RepID=A0A1I6YHY8_9BACT|nr:BCCT family transporter [Algoriphagus locisalis]SFT50018.1 Choline-glycine betaine transporter [Algoriphagus locisalis]
MTRNTTFFSLTIRPWVFWPPFILLIIAVASSILFPDSFISVFRNIQQLILSNFSLGFSWVSFLMTILTVVVLFSRLGNYKIGGKNAKPRLTRISWFAIVLCTTIAVGILFWGSAEPLSHFLFPPDFKGFEPGSEEAKSFAIGALYFHWGFTPYAIYAVPALVFALMYYSGKSRFSLGIMLRPILGSKPHRHWETGLDMFSLFALVSGMAAALGAGILSLSGGFLAFLPELNPSLLTGLITLGIIVTFIISASTGIEKGIKNLSLFNLGFFFLIASLFVLLGEQGKIMNAILTGFREYASNFTDLSLQLSGAGNSWTYDWSTFNFAMWMAWAPMTALFLGKIAVGRTVREFLLVNWFLPALFCLAWMGIFGGTTVDFASINPVLYQDLFQTSGPESIIYQVFKDMGYFKVFAQLFILGIFISYVTAADSSTDALASISMSKQGGDPFRSDTNLKVIWGVLIGFLSWVMINYSGIDGVRILSVIGGLPALFFLLLVSICLILILISPKKYLENQ